MSSSGGVSYADTGKASAGCPCIIETKDGKPYRFGCRKRDEIIEFLKEQMI